MSDSVSGDNTPASSRESPDKQGTSPSNDKGGRKRMRVPTSCSVCRKRKIKCDKTRPICSGCSKSNVGHLCHYEEPMWVSSKDLWKHAKPMSPPANGHSAANASTASATGPTPPASTDTTASTSSKQVFDELAARIKHIEASIAVSEIARSGNPLGEAAEPAPSMPSGPYTNSSYSGSNASTRYQQATNTEFIGSAEKQSGPAYDFNPEETIDMFDFLPFIIKKSRLEYHGGLDPKSIIKKDPHLKIVWLHLWKNFDKTLQSTIEKSDNGYNVVQNQTSQGFYDFLELRKHKQTIKKETQLVLSTEPNLENVILRYLPSKKCIMTLCFRFFKVVYPILPFVNENSFFQELETILGPSWTPLDDRPSKVNLSSKYDYATIGLLFLVMRFAYLSIEEHEYEKPDLACLKNITVHAGHVKIAWKCLEQYNFLRKSYSLRVLQVMLYIKLYYHYCPEDDDVSDGSEGTIMMGTIYSVALSLGLQTDPHDLVSLIKSPKTQSYGQLWRKIWYKILEMDATESISLGIIPNCPNETCYDTKLPGVEDGMDEVQTFIVEDFKFMNKKTALYRKLSSICFNRRKKPTVLQMVHLIREVENFMTVNFGSLKDVLTNPVIKSYVKVKKVTYLYEMNSILLSLKNRLLTHFYAVDNTKKVFELFDECLTLTMKILNSSLNLYYNLPTYFDAGHRLVLRPIAYSSISKAMLMIGSLLAKLSQCQKLVPFSDITRANLIKEFFNSLLNNMDIAVQLMSTVSSGYYNAQRIQLVMRLFYHKLKDPSFDFDRVAADATSREKEQTISHAHDIHAVTPSEIPKSNFIMSLLDTELAYLKAKTENDLVEVLQPLVGGPININLGTAPTPVLNPSGTGNGQFYDPTVDSLTVKTPGAISDAGGMSMGVQNGLNMNSIFATPGKNTIGGDASYDPNSLSSEEYASLFGLFEDYNLMNLDQRDLKGL